MPKKSDKTQIMLMIKATALAVIIYILLCVVFSMIFLKFNISKDIYLPLLMAASALPGFAAGFYSARKQKNNGLITGIIFSVLPAVFMLISMSAAYKGFSVYELILAVICIFAGGIGGVTALNIKTKTKKPKFKK